MRTDDTQLHDTDGRWPDMLTIVEAARVVRIGRSAAYNLAREYVDTDGASGLPAKRIGGQLP